MTHVLSRRAFMAGVAAFARLKPRAPAGQMEREASAERRGQLEREALAERQGQLEREALAERSVLAESIRVGYAAITWGGDDERAIREIAEVGFEGIQLRNSAVARFGANPRELRDLLASRDLT